MSSYLLLMKFLLLLMKQKRFCVHFKWSTRRFMHVGMIVACLGKNSLMQMYAPLVVFQDERFLKNYNEFKNVQWKSCGTSPQFQDLKEFFEAKKNQDYWHGMSEMEKWMVYYNIQKMHYREKKIDNL